MKPIKIGKAEELLLTAISEGKTANLSGATIQAELLRRIVLGLPLAGIADSVWGEVRRLFGRPMLYCDCPRTPVGISIRNAIVEGRLDLSSATGEEGGPMCPLAFEKCCFTAGFGGAHARFSRLSFKKCTFVDPWSKRSLDQATIELSGAAVDSDLHLGGIHPKGVSRNGKLERSMGNRLWIRLNGARIDGKIDLCGSHLRAPPTCAREMSKDASDALDLSLAEVKGDIQLLAARIEGRLGLRTAHVAGDVWMTGASCENPGEQAILIQGTRVDGFLMLDGGFRNSDKTGPFRTFKCRGTLKLEAAEIGRSLYLEDAIVRGPIEASQLTVRDDVILNAEVSGPIDLKGCRIGGSLDISKLNLAASARKVSLKDGSIGRTLTVAQPDVPYELVAARELPLVHLAPLKVVETLWAMVPNGRDEHDEEVPLRRQLIQAAFLVDDSSPRNVRILHLDGHQEVIDRAVPPGGREQLSPGARAELNTLIQAYVFRGTGPTQGDDASPYLENGLFVLPQMAAEDLQRKVDERDWFMKPPIEDDEGTGPDRKIIERLIHHIDANPLLQACFDLDGLTCELLDDRGGRAWGGHLNRIRMNHFSYRRAEWGGEARPAKPDQSVWAHMHEVFSAWLGWIGQIALVSRKPEGRKSWTAREDKRPTRWGGDQPVHTRRVKSSYQWQWDRMRGALADWLWPRTKGITATRLREESDYLEPWQIRRDWIYRQFTPLPDSLQDLISVSRYRIPGHQYRPQPFEQAILVARAEGREEVAVRFEMLKRKIEWHLFNQRIRWPLAYVGIFFASGWLVLQGGSRLPTALALVATWAMMAVASSLNDLLKMIPAFWPRRVIREVISCAPAFVLLLVDGWWERPFHFIVAFFIYFVIRTLSVASHLFMWFGFGYLRRPVRAIVTLLLAFLAGWWGVHLANHRDMLVVDAAPVADLAGPEPHAEYPYELPNRSRKKTPILMGSGSAQAGSGFVRELSCAPAVSEPLYALDVLIPLLDLREESRCEIRRVDERKKDGQDKAKDPRDMKWGQLYRSFPEFALADHRLWWWLKALYAIAGWFIVSLALLTFAQVNRTHGEPAEGG